MSDGVWRGLRSCVCGSCYGLGFSEHKKTQPSVLAGFCFGMVSIAHVFAIFGTDYRGSGEFGLAWNRELGFWPRAFDIEILREEIEF